MQHAGFLTLPGSHRLAVLAPHRLIRSLEQDVAVYADGETVAGRNLDRRLNVEITSRDLSAGLAQFLAYGASGGLGWAGVREGALGGALRDLEGGAEDAGENRESDDPEIMAIYDVSQPGVAV